MTGFGGAARRAGRGVARGARRIEVTTGLLLVFGGILLMREAADVLGGTQPVSGASPGVVASFLIGGAIVAIVIGLAVVRKGF